MDRRVSEYHHPDWHHGGFSQGDPIFLMLIAINFVKTLVILRTDAIGFFFKILSKEVSKYVSKMGSVNLLQPPQYICSAVNVKLRVVAAGGVPLL